MCSEADMPPYARDDDIQELARCLADRRNCTVTEAVRSALREALERDAADIEERRRRAREILARFDATPRLRPGFTDKDLYDENGLPIL
jgi:antitoxin VapB